MRALLVLLFLLTLHLRAPACGYYILGESVRIALLNPYLLGPDYQAFFYSSEEYYRFENARAGRDRLRNAAAWVDELGANVTEADVMELLYETPFTDYVAAREGRTDNALTTNTAWRAINADPALLEYLMWAKAYEVPHRVSPYGWEMEPDPVADERYYDDFYGRAMKGYAKAKEGSFLQRRYAYQLLLLARYDEDEEAMSKYFTTYFDGEDDVLSDWARYHFATQWNDPLRRVIELARAFRVTPEKALAIYQNTPQQLDPQRYLPATKNDAERSDLYALAAVKEPGKALALLQEAYRYNPDSELIPLLIVREINKLEDWLLSYRLTDYGPVSMDDYHWDTYPNFADYEAEKDRLRRANAVTDREYLKEVRAFLEGYAPNVERIGLSDEKIDLFRAQLSLLAEDYRGAEDQLSDYAPTDSLTRLQFGVDRFLVELQGKNPDRDRLARYLQEIAPLYRKDLDAGQSIAVLNRIASQSYAAAGDTLTAYFFQVKSLDLPDGSGYNSYYYQYLDYLDRPVSPLLMRQIAETVTTPPSGVFFDYVLSEIGNNQYDYEGNMKSRESWGYALYDLLGTQFLRRNDVAQAIRYLEQVPATFYTTDYEFASYLRGPTMGIYAVNPRTTSGKATKLEIAQRLQADLNASKNGNANSFARLGDYWYEMSYFGPSWMMLTYYKSVMPVEGPQAYPSYGTTPTTEADYQLLYQASRAEKYWKEARSRTDDAELLAELDFKLAMLDWQRARIAIDNWYSTPPETYDSLYRAHFDGFVDRQLDTEFFGTVAHQCSWFGNRYGG